MSTYALPPDSFLEGSLFREPLYHGTSARLTTGHFLRPELGREYGIYLTPRRKYARMYGPHVAEVYVRVRAPYVVVGKHEISPSDLTAADVKQLQRQGYDSIVVTSSTPEQASEVVLFNARQAWVAKQHNPSVRRLLR